MFFCQNVHMPRGSDGSKFIQPLSCTVIHHRGRHRRHGHDDNDDDVDDDDDDDDDDNADADADADVLVAIVIMTLTLNHPPLHQHQESDWLLVGFAVKV